MGAKRRAITLNGVFWLYTVSACIVVAIFLVIWWIAISLPIVTGAVMPANEPERLALNALREMEEAGEFERELVPSVCRYALLYSDGSVVESDMSEKQIEIARTCVDEGNYRNGVVNYISVRLQDQWCVIRYELVPTYTSEFMKEHFPDYQLLLLGSLVLAVLLSVIVTSRVYAGILKRKMASLTDATRKIADKDLEFEVSHTNVREIDDVLSALDEMKRALKSSLESQWREEQARNDQVSALAHDIKAPLTIIRGNVELMLEADGDDSEEFREYLGYIEKNVKRLEEYVSVLRDVSDSSYKGKVELKRVNTTELVQEIYDQAHSISVMKGIELRFRTEKLEKHICIDRVLILRAVSNILSNAFDHAEGVVAVDLETRYDEMWITVRDDGNGFSGKDLKFALDRFYMGDESRSAKGHYGMGLYIASMVAEAHGGEVTLSNGRLDDEYGMCGAVVRMSFKC